MKHHIFPDLSQRHSSAMEDKPVLLDGQKVLFDKKVTLMPVELEKKTEKNGKSNR
ncbi:MAG: hypothetical protein AAF806_07705 [Bacteroidota bacterium]